MLGVGKRKDEKLIAYENVEGHVVKMLTISSNVLTEMLLQNLASSFHFGLNRVNFKFKVPPFLYGF